MNDEETRHSFNRHLAYGHGLSWRQLLSQPKQEPPKPMNAEAPSLWPVIFWAMLTGAVVSQVLEPIFVAVLR